MKRKTVQGIVIRTYDFGETDRIIVLHSSSEGQVRGVAKGVRRPGSRFGGRLEPHCLVEVDLYQGTNLYTITGAELLIAHEGLRQDWIVSTCAAVIAQVVLGISQEGNKDLPMFVAHKQTLAQLNRLPLHPLGLVDAFLLRAASLEGQRAQLQVCAVCKATDIAGFSVAKGGVTCAAHTASKSARISQDLWGYLRVLMEAPLGDVAYLDVPNQLAKEGAILVESWFKEQIPIHMSALQSLPR